MMIVAIPTEENRGMMDKVSRIFAKAPHFTFVEIVEGKRKGVTVEKKEVSKFPQGSGPLVMKNLKDKGVDVALAGKIARAPTMYTTAWEP